MNCPLSNSPFFWEEEKGFWASLLIEITQFILMRYTFI